VIDYTVLNTELTNDPKNRGYAVPMAAGDTGEVARLLNEQLPTESVERASITPQEAQAAVDVADFKALTAGAQRAWLAIVGLPEVPVKNPQIRAQVAAIWGPGTATRANLVALQTRDASRAEVLFGEGISVTHLDVARALA
jgi:hypothetical protein